MVEDSAIDRRKVGGYLKDWGLDHIIVGTGTEAVEILARPDPPTMALLDWMVPEIDGIELCRRIRALGVTGSYIYTVMLTSRNRKQDLLTAMEAGADDYLSKPVNADELRARILAGKRILDLQQSLKFAASHDALTGLLNRAEILEALHREFSRSCREGRPAALILADIDHFKRTNDSMGHHTGDIVLKEVARRLKMDLRDYDMVGRYGGEEFLLILPGCDLRVGVRRANEIRALVSKGPIVTPLGTSTPTVSMGVTVMSSGDDHTIADLLQQADVAMYQAKKNGRNRVEVFASSAKAAFK